jgi:hypothetical protein
MHPLAVKVPGNPRPISATVDWNYPALNVSHADDVYIIRDSDDGVIASLSPYTYAQNEQITFNATRRRRIRNLKEWVNVEWALNFHVLQMSEPVYFHMGSKGSEWEEGLRAVDAVWKPFRHYIDSHRSQLPEATIGYSLDLLTRAVKVTPLKRIRPLARTARQRFFRKLRRKIYSSVSHRLSN